MVSAHLGNIVQICRDIPGTFLVIGISYLVKKEDGLALALVLLESNNLLYVQLQKVHGRCRVNAASAILVACSQYETTAGIWTS